MAEKFLNHPDIRATVQQVRGERMPQDVRRYLRQSGTRAGGAQRPPGALPRQPAAARIQEKGWARLAPSGRRGERWTCSHQVRVHRVPGEPPHWYQALLAALAIQTDDGGDSGRRRVARQLDVVHIESDGLGDPGTSSVQQLE